MQSKLPEGATVAPIILSSDKTQLSVFSGDKAAYPVYITIGNISKATRRQPSKHATLLLGYLSDDSLKSHILSDAARSIALRRLFHDSLGVIVSSLEAAGRQGVKMVCADGMIRHVFPVLSSYVCDHPEQCLVAGVKYSHCPICEVPAKEKGSTTEHPLRSREPTIAAIANKLAKVPDTEFARLGLHPVRPFWSNLPHVDIGSLFTPDILHQLHKGMFSTHLTPWVQSFIQEPGKSAKYTKEEIDRRFRAITVGCPEEPSGTELKCIRTSVPNVPK